MVEAEEHKKNEMEDENLDIFFLEVVQDEEENSQQSQQKGK